PERVDAQALDVVEPACEPLEVAAAVAVAVHERLDVQAVEDGVLVPEVRKHAVNLPEPALGEPLPGFANRPRREPPPRWQTPDTSRGGATPSSIRSTPGRSLTRAATAWATSGASSGASTTSFGSESMPSGSRRSTGRRWRTSVTT